MSADPTRIVPFARRRPAAKADLRDARRRCCVLTPAEIDAHAAALIAKIERLKTRRPLQIVQMNRWADLFLDEDAGA